MKPARHTKLMDHCKGSDGPAVNDRLIFEKHTCLGKIRYLLRRPAAHALVTAQDTGQTTDSSACRSDADRPARSDPGQTAAGIGAHVRDSGCRLALVAVDTIHFQCHSESGATLSARRSALGRRCAGDRDLGRRWAADFRSGVRRPVRRCIVARKTELWSLLGHKTGLPILVTGFFIEAQAMHDTLQRNYGIELDGWTIGPMIPLRMREIQRNC